MSRVRNAFPICGLLGWQTTQIALPPLTDEANGLAWPDTLLGVRNNGNSYVFFSSDGAFHTRQDLEYMLEGNQTYGSVTRSLGILNDLIGSESAIDVTIKTNPDQAQPRSSGKSLLLNL